MIFLYCLFISLFFIIYFLCHGNLLLAALIKQHSTKQQPPISKTIQVRETRYAGHCWRSKNEHINDTLIQTPTHGYASVGQPARTYLHQLCVDTGCILEDLLGVKDDREKGRVRKICAVRMTWWWFSMYLLDILLFFLLYLFINLIFISFILLYILSSLLYFLICLNKFILTITFIIILIIFLIVNIIYLYKDFYHLFYISLENQQAKFKMFFLNLIKQQNYDIYLKETLVTGKNTGHLIWNYFYENRIIKKYPMSLLQKSQGSILLFFLND